MPSKHNLGDLRAAIKDTYRQVIAESENGEAPNHVVLARLAADRQSLLDLFAPQFQTIALTKLLNEECRKTISGQGGVEQGELFAEVGLGHLAGIPEIVTIGREKKKRTIDLSIRQAKKWLEDHKTRVVRNDNRVFAQLVERCESLAQSENETIGDVLQRLLESHEIQPPAELEPAE